MKVWLRNHRLSASVVAATVLLPVILLIYILSSLWLQRMEYQEQVDRLKPRIARLQGLIESEQTLLANSGQVQARVSELVFPDTASRQAVAAELQTNIRQAMTAAGMQVLDTRILPALEQETVLERISLTLTLRGPVAALDQGLLDLANYQPRILVEYLDIKPDHNRPAKGEKFSAQTVTASLKLTVLKRQSDE